MAISDLMDTPLPTFNRTEILARLRRTIDAGLPIIAAGSSCGLVAKSAEAGGADLLVVYSTGLSRMRGLPTTVEHGSANQTTLGMAHEILNVVADTPVICGLEAIDPKFVRLAPLLDQVQQVGYSGVINFPTITDYEPGSRRRMQRESVGFGFRRETRMVELAREREMFTMSYVFDVDETRQMVESGVDVVVAHVGATSGGLDGFSTHNIDRATDLVNEMLEEARSINPEVLVLAHGGPFDVAENVNPLYQRSKVQGFVGASSIERIPIEIGVADAVRAFKDARIQS